MSYDYFRQMLLHNVYNVDVKLFYYILINAKIINFEISLLKTPFHTLMSNVIIARYNKTFVITQIKETNFSL